MRLSLDALQVLDAIDRKGSFAAAANELHRVPSAVTYTVQQLEQDLDVLLFDRSKHRASLTLAGQELLAEGRLLLRAATELESRIQQVARGWETELKIAVDTAVGPSRILALVEQFYAENSGTRIKITEEVLNGNWDALVAGRCDLVIGASGDEPSGGFASLLIGRIGFVFVAAPTHAICQEPQPLTEATILKYRAVSVADSSRNLAPRTIGLLSGQDVFTVPTMQMKMDAHIAGLGVGYLPANRAARPVAAGQLQILEVASLKAGGDLYAVWKPNRTGKALRWFAKALAQPKVQAALMQDAPLETALNKQSAKRSTKLAKAPPQSAAQSAGGSRKRRAASVSASVPVSVSASTTRKSK